jgi:hypothetical protein
MFEIGKSYKGTTALGAHTIFKCTALTFRNNVILEFMSSLGRIVEVVVELDQFHRFEEVVEITKKYKVIASTGYVRQLSLTCDFSRDLEDYGYLEFTYKNNKFHSVVLKKK